MNRRMTVSSDHDILSSLKALRRAAQRALKLGLSTGTPVYVMKAGKIVDLTQNITVSVGEAPMAVREGHAAYGITQSTRGTLSVRSGRHK